MRTAASFQGAEDASAAPVVLFLHQPEHRVEEHEAGGPVQVLAPMERGVARPTDAVVPDRLGADHPGSPSRRALQPRLDRPA